MRTLTDSCAEPKKIRTTSGSSEISTNGTSADSYAATGIVDAAARSRAMDWVITRGMYSVPADGAVVDGKRAEIQNTCARRAARCREAAIFQG